MSRLDDELKIAFKRQEPSLDFTARVLERINQAPAKQPTFRQKLAAFFEMPASRWAAVGLATAALLIAIGVMQYGGVHQQAAQVGDGLQAGITPPHLPSVEMHVDQVGGSVESTPAPNVTAVKTPPRHHAHRSTHELVAAKGNQGPRPSPEAEAAKERVLFALQIAGNALNDAQRAIQEDSRQEKPEPLHNR